MNSWRCPADEISVTKTSDPSQVLTLVAGGQPHELSEIVTSWLVYAGPLTRHHVAQCYQELSEGGRRALDAVLVDAEHANNDTESARLLEAALVIVRSYASGGNKRRSEM